MGSASHHSVVHQQFDGQAAAYLTSAVHADGADLDQIVLIAGGLRPEMALDLGCGGGHVSYRLSPYAGRVVAYDLSPSMVAMVAGEADRRGLTNIVARQGAVEQIPYPDQSFDLVVTRYSAHHWYDFATGLSEARRVLKKSGQAVFIDVVSPGVPLLDGWLQTLELLRDPSHVYNRSAAEWQAMVISAGFRPAERFHAKLHIDFGSWVKRMNTPAAHVTAIRSLQEKAGRDVADYFKFEADGSFTIDTMILVADAI